VPVPVKVIVEATLLGEDQLRRACEAVRAAGADYVKTSTGFAGGGAELDDVRVMAEYLPVKASGGIGSYDAAAAMLEAGAERIGASAGVDLVEGFGAEGGGDA
jgi:deoxyribose-phosphate aldolase